MKNKNVITLFIVCCTALLLVACSSAIETFSKEFEVEKYTECAQLYETEIQNNTEKEKALQDYLLPKAKENLEIYKLDAKYKDSKAEDMLENMAIYATQTTEELGHVLDEYNRYKSSRRAYINAKEKMDFGSYEEAIKMFEQVLVEDSVSQDVTSLIEESQKKWQVEILEEVDSFLKQENHGEALSLLKTHETLLKDNTNYKLVLGKANDLKQKDDEKKAAEEEKAKLEAEEKEKRLAASLTKMRTNKDEVRGITWYYDKTTPKYTDVNNIHLYIGEDEGKNNPWLRLCIQYYADSWLFIESYTIKVDDNMYTITPQGYGSVERDNGGGDIWEWYDTSPTDKQIEMVKEIIKSNKTIIRHEGKQYYDDREITVSEKKALQNVLDAFEYLETRKVY